MASFLLQFVLFLGGFNFQVGWCVCLKRKKEKRHSGGGYKDWKVDLEDTTSYPRKKQATQKVRVKGPCRVGCWETKKHTNTQPRREKQKLKQKKSNHWNKHQARERKKAHYYGENLFLTPINFFHTLMFPQCQ